MMARRAHACVAIAALFVTGGCRRKAPAYRTLPEPFARTELSLGAAAKDAADTGNAAGQPAAGTAVPPRRDVFVQQVVPGDVSALIADAHAHPAVGSLQAAGCDFALVLTGAGYDRLVQLGPGRTTAKLVDDPAGAVVYCASSTTSPPPDCAALAPIFARVARPKRRFHVLGGSGVVPTSPRCSGIYDVKGKPVAAAH